MAKPASREELKDYCLRQLGAPVLEINVDDDQLEDRLDEALDYWNLYHYEGIEQIYMKQQIRASELYPVSGGTAFNIADKITGLTSGATAEVVRESTRVSTDTMILVKNVEGTFQAGETIDNGDGTTASSQWYISEDLTNQSIISSDGHIHLNRHWINNGTYNYGLSTVFLLSVTKI